MASSHGGSRDESETALLDALDATDEYLRHQHALAMALKDGYMNISRARYSMGATSVGESHYASEMEPLLHVVAAGKDCLGQPEWRLERGACEKLGSRPAGRDGRAGAAGQGAESAAEQVPACGLHAAPPKRAGGGSSSDRAAEAGYSSLISEFAARFACSSDGAGAAAEPPGEGAADSAAPLAEAAAHSLAAPSAAEAPLPAAGQAKQSPGTLPGASKAQAERGAEAECGPPGQQGFATGEGPAREPRARRDPLLWFGALVPPHLRTGQADFAIAVEAAVHLANARQRLLAALKRAEAGCRALPEEPPAAVQALAHVVNGVSA